MTNILLEQAYLDTIYTVMIGNATYDIEVNQPDLTMVEKLLRDTNSHSGIILTAWNPQSSQLTVNENQSRNKSLVEDLMKDKLTYYHALGVGKDDAWQAEESFFILDIDKDKAELLACRYQQNAYIWIEKNTAAKLIFSSVYCDE